MSNHNDNLKFKGKHIYDDTNALVKALKRLGEGIDQSLIDLGNTIVTTPGQVEVLVDGSVVDGTNPFPVEITNQIEVEVPGLSTPKATHTSPNDFTASYTSATTLTVNGVTIASPSQISYIKVIPATGDAKIYANGDGKHTLTNVGGAITVAGADVNPFAAGDSYEVGLNLQDKGYSSEDLIKIQDQSPEWAHFTNADYEPINETNVSVNTYFKKINMEGFRGLSLQLAGISGGSGVTFKIYESLDPNALVTSTGGTPDPTVWSDISTRLDILGAASVTLNNQSKSLHISDKMPASYMVEYTVDDSSNEVKSFFRKH